MGTSTSSSQSGARFVLMCVRETELGDRQRDRGETEGETN